MPNKIILVKMVYFMLAKIIPRDIKPDTSPV